MRAYDSHSLKQIYSINTLNLPMVALSFGFKVPPYVDLSILYAADAPEPMDPGPRWSLTSI